MKLDSMAGEHISQVAEKAVALVAGGEPVVTFDFNEVEIKVVPGMTAQDVTALYSTESERRRLEYVSTPEYKAREAKRAVDAKAAEERASLQRGRLYATAPDSMTLKNADLWAKARANNRDPYGNAVMVYAETWARLMEGAMAQGATVEGCAKETSHLADTDGITGFMYGAAVSTLAGVWAHGEALRRWHNKGSQLGTEGDEANARGGVLNPAILSIGAKS